MTDHYIHPHKKHRRTTPDGPEFVQPGEPFVPTEAELAAYGDVLEPYPEAGNDLADAYADAHADADADDDYDDDDADADADVPIVGEMSVSEIREYVTGVDDVDHLDRLYDDEAEGDARTTALDAIEARIRALSGVDDDHDDGDA